MTHTYQLIEAKISMKMKEKKGEKNEIMRCLVFKASSVCLFFFVS